jgi:hypothetical protein
MPYERLNTYIYVASMHMLAYAMNRPSSEIIFRDNIICLSHHTSFHSIKNQMAKNNKRALLLALYLSSQSIWIPLEQ